MTRALFSAILAGVAVAPHVSLPVSGRGPDLNRVPSHARSQAPTFRTGVETVVVYATVNDANGRLVPDLPQDAFQILDNGRPVQITVFSHEPQSLTVALMLDMSNSMRDRVLRVRDAALHFVDTLQPGDRASIGTFGEEIAISPLLTGDKQVLTRVLYEELWPGGFTPLWRAMDAAMTALDPEPGRRVILVLTDGDDYDFFVPAPLQADVERRAIRGPFMVYAIGMEGKGLASGIIDLTGQTGGGHFELKSAAELGSTFARVVLELRHQYLLGFIPSTFDGRLHKLEVRSLRPGMKVRARKSYQAGAER